MSKELLIALVAFAAVLAGSVFGVLRQLRPMLRGPAGHVIAVAAAVVVAAIGIFVAWPAVDTTPSAPPRAPTVVSFHLEGHRLGQDLAVGLTARLEACDGRPRFTAVVSPTQDAGLPRTRDDAVELLMVVRQPGLRIAKVGLTARDASPRGDDEVRITRELRWQRRDAPAERALIAVDVPAWGRHAPSDGRLPSLAVVFSADVTDKRSSTSCWLRLPVLRGNLVTRELAQLGLPRKPFVAAAEGEPGDRRRVRPLPGSAVAGSSELLLPGRLNVDSTASEPEPAVTTQFQGPRWTCTYEPRPTGASAATLRDRVTASASYYRAAVGEQPTCAAAAAIVDTDTTATLQLVALAGGLLLGLAFNILVGAWMSDFAAQHPARTDRRR